MLVITRRLDHAHAHRHRAAVRRLRGQRAAGRDRSGRHRQCQCWVPGRSGRRPRRATSSLSIDGPKPTTPEEFVAAIQVAPTGRRGRRWFSIATASTLDQVGRARRQPECRRDLRQGVPRQSGRATRTAGTTSRCRTAAVDSFTDLGPIMWHSVGGVVKVLNPVNIHRSSHRVATTTRARSRPPSSASAGSASTIGDEPASVDCC